MLSRSRTLSYLILLLGITFKLPTFGAHAAPLRKVSTVHPRANDHHSLTTPATFQLDKEPANAFTHADFTESFTSVCVVSAFNIVFNALRPDDSISMQARVPRIMWELVLFCIANATRKPSTSPATYILLALTTASTAAVDIFVWAPLFGLAASFKSCSGGWFTGRQYTCQTDYVKGVGRLLVSVQSVCTGIVYLVAAINAWGAFTALRDEQKLQHRVRAMEMVADGTQAHSNVIV